jgi:hypothetical protein
MQSGTVCLKDYNMGGQGVTDTTEVLCGRCGELLDIPAELLGQDVKCPTCQHEFSVPPPIPLGSPVGAEEVDTKKLRSVNPPKPSPGKHKAAPKGSTTSPNTRDWAKYRAEILAAQQKWSRLDSALQSLRDEGRIYGRISREIKADIIIAFEKRGKKDYASLFSHIKEHYPQFIPKALQDKKGCLGLVIAVIGMGACIALAILKLASFG